MNNLGITCRRKTKFLLLFSTFAFACIVLITIKQVTEQGGNTFFSSFCQCTRNLSEDNVKKQDCTGAARKLLSEVSIKM